MAGVILVVLTWIKTLEIKRQAMHTGMRTPLTDLLLCDGKYCLYLISAADPVSTNVIIVGRNSILRNPGRHSARVSHIRTRWTRVS
ncbi:hypothetical protein ONZ51_g7255 [Trametes cubensis]|uniref:Uncharacterized protein n=1 Tax=Trametes cubensis TaxID=1111947 RepID=A0AAD7TT22_9APHY|nr:hypothetical protein ONZ51_g7255 [Trametes cubensis]